VQRVDLCGTKEHQASGLICYSWRLPPPRWLGARDSVEHFKKIVKWS
jgi:hypothetical protein